MIAVLDTNVLVSGMMYVHSTPGRILELVFLDRVKLAFDDRIFAEYISVLGRPRFRTHIDPADRDNVLAHIRLNGRHVAAGPLPGLDPAGLSDPDDLCFAEVAVAAGAQAIISGNTRHFAFFEGNSWKVEVLPPAEALERFCAES